MDTKSVCTGAMTAPGEAADPKLLALAQQQLDIERQLRTMLEEEAANAQERFEHEQVYQQHCQEEVRRVPGDGRRCAAASARVPGPAGCALPALCTVGARAPQALCLSSHGAGSHRSAASSQTRRRRPCARCCFRPGTAGPAAR